MLLDALAAPDQRPVAGAGAGEEGLDERGLADAGLAGDHDQARLAARGRGEVPAQLGQLGLAADDGSRAPPPRGLEPRLRSGRRRGGRQARVLLQDAPLELAERG